MGQNVQLTSGNLCNYGKPRLSLFWRIIIVFVAVAGIWWFIRGLADALFGPDYSRLAHVFRAVLTSLAVIPLIWWARLFFDRRSWDGLGLARLRSGWRLLLIGMVCWLIPAAIGISISVALGWTEVVLREPISVTLRLAAGLLLLVFIYEALPEELIFRGYFYRNLASEMPRWTAVLGQAILFMLWGLVNGGPISLERSTLFFTAAIILGIFRAITGSIWASIGFHLAFQTVAQLFGSIGNQFIISEPHILTVVAFGIVPFASGITLLRLFYKGHPDWRDREPDFPSNFSGHKP